ncbi:hypothetical protein, conserved [Plasmodium gonderi]|uniref:Uncharacterized protein n=1 Tax=Plasmodium gonderi TaxID=77519 RepID=A0A1Y1JP80_PLAGO|nr:hypothetical protein, conserved [Plasmodium gonderi]GAW83348.1 hypothetical protein, conserved [Plasmodium gonderi]
MEELKNIIPDEVKEILSCLQEGNSNFQKYFGILKNEYLNKDPINNTTCLVKYILKNLKISEFQKNACHYLADIVLYIQGVNKIIRENENEFTEDILILDKKDEFEFREGQNYDSVYPHDTIYPEYRVEIRDGRLRQFTSKDYRNEIIKNCTKNINYLELMYVISTTVSPQNGYVLYNNIFHKVEISYQYKLLSLEYFAHVVNKITTERAKYIAQILPLILEKFYSIDGSPYYNDRVNNLDTLVSMCKFVNVLCDESIKAQEDDKEDVALHSIVAFIMKILSYHNTDLPINRNVERLLKHIHYDDLDYEECLKVYTNLSSNLYKNKKEIIVKECLSCLTWRLSIINSNIPRILESVNIIIPNTNTCALENSTLEISILCYLILIERINELCFPLIYSELYLFNLMMRNSYNLILCVPEVNERIKYNLLIKAYHFIFVCSVISKIISKRSSENYSNIHNFKWRPLEFLKTLHRTLYDYRKFKTYSKSIYNSICIIMRHFHWDIFYSLHYKLLNEALPDNARSLIAAFVKDEIYKQIIRIIKKEDLMKENLYKNENFAKYTNIPPNGSCEKNNTNSLVTQEGSLEEMKINEFIKEINNLGQQIKNIIYLLLSEDSVLLNVDSIIVVLNMIKMILLNKKFKSFYKFVVNIDQPSTCFLQSKIKHFYNQIKIEKTILEREKREDGGARYTGMEGNALVDIPYHKMIISKDNSISMNELEIIVMLLGDVETSIENIKAFQER